jgi:TetR/AcrR family transcriptional regulator
VTTRERLLDVASDLFAERGFDGVSVRDITRAAHANLGAVTYHFQSKEALFAEVVSRELAPFIEGGKEIASRQATPEAQLRAMLEFFALRVMHERPRLKVFFAECLAGGRRLPDRAQEGMAFRNRVFAEIIQRGIQEGVFRPFDTTNGAWMFFGMLSAYILFQPLMGTTARAHGYAPEFVKSVVDTAMSVFLDGIRARGTEGTARK